MITHHTEPDGTLVIRVGLTEKAFPIHQAIVIAQKAADHFGITLGLMLGNERHSSVSEARQMAIHLALEETNINLCALGRIYNGRVHDTMNHLLNRCRDALEVEPAYRRRYEALRAAVLADGKEARSA